MFALGAVLSVATAEAQKNDIQQAKAKADSLWTDSITEVVVTARVSKGPVTSSVIGRDAMKHLQPNSLADLMELLPGGYAKDPNMGEANTINLRETGTMGAYGSATKNNNYSISSLGTQFVVDGVPISTDANFDKDYCKTVDAITAKDIQQMAKELLRQNHRVEVTMLSE